MKHFLTLLIGFPVIIISLAGCKTVKTDTSNNKTYKLVWYDDFNGTQLDTSKWSKVPRGKSDWDRHMSSDSLCYELKDGKLYLKGIINPDTLKDTSKYITGGIYSKGKFAFQYGKVEIKAKLGCAKGAWPAMWMLASEQKYGNYPRNGEIDIMEHLNYDNKVYQTVHSYYTLILKKENDPPHYGTAKIDTSKFNIFGLEWFPDKLVFSVNGKTTFVYPKVKNADTTQWPFDQPFYLLIDQQLGGRWVGKINPDDLPVSMIIDWVKIYQ